jgi:hypothetical protein
MVDTNRENISAARMEGIPAYLGSILSEHILNDLDMDGIGRLFALTSNDEANSLAALHMADTFEREEMYQLPPLSERSGSEPNFSPYHLRGRFMFGEGINYTHLNSLFQSGWVIKSTKITEEFRLENINNHYEGKIVPLFLIDKDGKLHVSTIDNPVKPSPGETVIALVLEKDEQNAIS